LASGLNDHKLASSQRLTRLTEYRLTSKFQLPRHYISNEVSLIQTKPW